MQGQMCVWSAFGADGLRPMPDDLYVKAHTQGIDQSIDSHGLGPSDGRKALGIVVNRIGFVHAVDATELYLNLHGVSLSRNQLR
jgi:hypothetical protein